MKTRPIDFLVGVLEDNTFVVDFPDVLTTKILSDRWLNTASILGVTYQHTAVPFGEGRVHYKAVVVGEPDDVERLYEFIDNSLVLLDNGH